MIYIYIFKKVTVKDFTSKKQTGIWTHKHRVYLSSAVEG